MDQHRLHLHGEQHHRRVVVHHGFSRCRQVLSASSRHGLPLFRDGDPDVSDGTRGRHLGCRDETFDLDSTCRHLGGRGILRAAGGSRVGRKRPARRVVDHCRDGNGIGWNPRRNHHRQCRRRRRHVHQSHIRGYRKHQLHAVVRSTERAHDGGVEQLHGVGRYCNPTRAHHECQRSHLRKRLHHPARGGDS